MMRRIKIGSNVAQQCKFSLIILAGLAVYCSTHSLRLQPFRSRKSPSETILEYEIVDPVVSSSGGQTSREGHPKEINVILNTIEKDAIHLKLKLNDVLMVSEFASGYYTKVGNSIENTRHDNCFYHGTVEGYEDWSAVFSTCYGLRGWFGSLHDSSNLYHIEPIEDTSSLTGPHTLYTDSQYQNNQTRSCSSSSDSLHYRASDARSTVSDQAHTMKKRGIDEKQRTLEWLIVNDYQQYLNYGSNITAVTHRALELVNQVNLFYKQVNIRVVLVYMVTWTDSNHIKYTSDPNILLDYFKEYHRTNEELKNIEHDSAMLVTGIDINGTVVGLAYVNTMCQYDDGVAFIQDTGTSVDGTTAAHELGHVFNMNHDDNKACECPDSSSGCIMHKFVTKSHQFSECSTDELLDAIHQGKDICLDNNPITLVGDPVCGNGVKEPGEVCDCGSLEECQDPCCDASSCTLSEGSDCAEGECCENCQFKPYGTICCESRGECGIAEYCTGDTTECPRDVYQQDGTPCKNGKGVCYDGHCPTHSEQCISYYGPDSKSGHTMCYGMFNIQGEAYGHCGVAHASFIKCASEDVQCGLLQCESPPGHQQPLFHNIKTSSAIIHNVRYVFYQGFFLPCQSFTTKPTVDEVSPGLVKEGTLCGDNMLCISNHCVHMSSLQVTPCPVGSNGEVCSGNGMCNNLDKCSCNIGHRGIDCSQ